MKNTQGWVLIEYDSSCNLYSKQLNNIMKPLLLLILFFFVVTDLTAQNDFDGQKVYEKAWVLTSNFALPAVRFNRWKNGFDENSSGQLELFNSVGAGLSLLYGNIIQIEDKDNSEEPLSTDFSNVIGVHFGALFSKSNAEGGLDDNVFAIVAGVSVLDVQIGYGREFGDRAEGIKRGFVTISYAIPLFKLTKKSALNLNKLNEDNSDKSPFF
ncbi:MAG: hypothetical protein AAF693_06545 [Bacteroidota bacterium]